MPLFFSLAALAHFKDSNGVLGGQVHRNTYCHIEIHAHSHTKTEASQRKESRELGKQSSAPMRKSSNKPSTIVSSGDASYGRVNGLRRSVHDTHEQLLAVSEAGLVPGGRR